MKKTHHKPEFASRNLPRKSVSLARALSKLGICSRSQAVGIILEGSVQVNQQTQRNPDFMLDMDHDTISVHGKKAKPAAKLYVMLNKPKGLVTTANDEKGRETVFSCFTNTNFSHISPVGQLDKASEGLLLFTNDTRWGNRITDPSFHVEKTYHVQVQQLPEAGIMRKMIEGIWVTETDLAPDAPEKVLLKARRVTPVRQGDNNAWLEVVLDEGKNRHIRRLFEAMEIEIRHLIRVSIGDLALGDLAQGAWRFLTEEEANRLAPPKTAPEAPATAAAPKRDYRAQRSAPASSRSDRGRNERSSEHPRGNRHGKGPRPQQDSAAPREGHRDDRPRPRRDSEAPREGHRDDRPRPRRDSETPREGHRDDRPRPRRDSAAPREGHRDDRPRPRRDSEAPREGHRDDRPRPRRDSEAPREGHRDDRPRPRRDSAAPRDARRNDRPRPRRDSSAPRAERPEHGPDQRPAEASPRPAKHGNQPGKRPRRSGGNQHPRKPAPSDGAPRQRREPRDPIDAARKSGGEKRSPNQANEGNTGDRPPRRRSGPQKGFEKFVKKGQ
jgi:23S rRNA pseudouridine2605 synthase